MTDENKQALGKDKNQQDMLEFEAFCKSQGLSWDFDKTKDLWGRPKYKHSHIDSHYYGFLLGRKYALQPKPSVDVEGLKKDLQVYLDSKTGLSTKVTTAVANKTIDYLHSQGHLNQEWRDISSAPKDGKIIQLYGLNALGKKRTINAIYTLKHDEPAEFCDDNEWLDEHDGEYYYPEGWYEIIWCSFDLNMYKVTDYCIKPTHWMPLPQPPKSEGE